MQQQQSTAKEPGREKIYMKTWLEPFKYKARDFKVVYVMTSSMKEIYIHTQLSGG